MITLNQSMEYKWCNHALRRWSERFPYLNKEFDFATAKLATKKQKSLVKKLTPVNAKKYMRRFSGRYFLVSSAGVVYVVAAKGVNKRHDVLTVFSLKGDNT